MTDVHSRTLFQLSYPLFLQSLVMFAVMAIDMMIWSAHGPGTATAMSIGGQVLRIAVELSTVLGIGGVILISQHLGRGDVEAARQTATIACVCNGLVGVGLGLALALAGPAVLGLMSLDADLEGDARAYLYFSSLAMVFLCFGNAAVSALRGFGQSRTVMILGVFGALFYLLLEYLLVLGPGPFPALGAAGAGLANLLTRLVFAALLAFGVVRLLKLKLNLRTALENLRVARRMAALALPSVSDFIAYGFYQLVLIGFIASHGEIELLSRAYVMIAMAFLTLVIMAIVQGTEVLIGYRIGAGNHRAARHQSLQSVMVAVILSTLCAVLIYWCSGPFIALFSTDPEVHALCRRLLWLTIFLQPCFAVNMVLFHVLRAVEDVRWPVIASQGLSWGLGLPLAWVMCNAIGLGVVGVWYALIAEEVLKATAMAWRWSRVQSR